MLLGIYGDACKLLCFATNDEGGGLSQDELAAQGTAVGATGIRFRVAGLG